MNIVIGKLGKSILFNRDSWGAIGGDNEPPLFYENLFHKNPNINFYILGSSDYSRIDKEQRDAINKNNNVFDIYHDWKQWRKNNKHIEEGKLKIAFIKEKLQTLPKMDAGVIFAGPISTSINVDSNLFQPRINKKTLIMFSNYAGPILHFLNETNIPWTMIVNDPRYNINRKVIDIFNIPKEILSQIDETYNLKSMISYTDHTIIDRQIECKYSGVEKIFLINNEKNFTTEKTKKFMVVCNEGLPSRYGDIKKYILNYIDDIEIYGKWDIKTTGEDSRFKGPKKFNDLQEMLPLVKYTFCIPIKKHWATAKFWEMINYGIIPFLHPLYDTQNNIKCPDFIRIQNEDDLYKKIDYLERNPNRYNELLKALKNMLLDEYYTGEYMNNVIVKSIENIVK